MASKLKITKKHHRHLNNPFPSPPESSLVEGTLFLDPQLQLVSSSTTTTLFSIGKHFQLSCRNSNGGYFSISHISSSNPDKPIWSSLPGQAFVSAALADTEVEESRGSFLVKDSKLHFVCHHQTVEQIREINHHTLLEGPDFPSGFGKNYDDMEFPALLISGRVFSNKVKLKKKKKSVVKFPTKTASSSVSARYCVVFNQRSSKDIEFQVKFGRPTTTFHHTRESRSPSPPSVVRNKYRVKMKKKLGWYWFFPKGRGIIALSSIVEKEEEAELKVAEEEEEEELVEEEFFNRVCFTYSSEADERFYGFGEQFSHMDFKGRRVPIFVQEQGIGRGDQPITFAANLVSHRAGGDWSTTYAPSPFYITSRMRSLYLDGYNYSIFDLTRKDRVQIQVHGDSIQGRILHGESPTDLIQQFAENIGKPPELPEWILSGAIVGMQGGTDTVHRVWDQLKALQVPISAFWLQDWVGQRETFIGSQLWWNWEVDTRRYWGWKRLIEELGAQNIKVMTYCNPCLAPIGTKPNFRKNLFEEAKGLGILAKDKNGEPYMVPNTAFDVGMLDLTHPDTATWFKRVLKEMVDDGVRGWMADFGEGLPVDAVLYSGEDPIRAHNRYPELWAQINREFVDEWKKDNIVEGEDQGDGLVFFLRAGFRNSPKWGMLFWEGDQMVSWQANDGIKSSVVGLLSSGLSGYAFNHSDIGGYCAVSFPLIKYQRSEELLLRWMELNSFTTVFRTHEGNKPSSNVQFYSNQTTLSHFARFAQVYSAWKFYRIQLVKEAAQKGLPVCRHLFLHYPNDENVQRLSYQQFLLGTEILVVPVLDKGRNRVKAYFPKGESCSWQHIWTGNLYSNHGSETWVEARIGYPAVFVKAESAVGETFLTNLRNLQLV